MDPQRELTEQDYNLLSSIAKRAKSIYDPAGFSRDTISWFMDFETVHRQLGLDLERFLNADQENFVHDVGGIAKHLNRETKELEDCFSPRFLKR